MPDITALAKSRHPNSQLDRIEFMLEWLVMQHQESDTEQSILHRILHRLNELENMVQQLLTKNDQALKDVAADVQQHTERMTAALAAVQSLKGN